MAPLTISPGSTEGKLKVTAAAAMPQGPVDLSLSATASDGSTANGALPIFVRGAPGTVDTTFAPGGLFIGAAQDATLTLLADGSMVAAATVGTGARLVHVDTDGKSLASTDAGVGAQVAPLPDGRYLNFGGGKLARFSAKLERDTSLNGGSGFVTTGASWAGSAAEVAVAGGKAYLLSQPDSQNVTVRRFSADGILESSSCAINAPASATLRAYPESLDVDATGQLRVVFTNEIGADRDAYLYGCDSGGTVNLGGAVNTPAPLLLGKNVFASAIANDGVGGFFVAQYLNHRA